MRHISLPETLSAEQLADWIIENKVDQVPHLIPIDDETRQEHEHKSASASMQILKLEELKKSFNDKIKEGTYTGEGIDGQPTFEDSTWQIPSTKGLKALKASVQYHSQILEDGATSIELYLVPWPEQEKIVAVDIEGKEYPQKTRDMNAAEKKKHTTLFKDESEPVDQEEEQQEEEEGDTDSLI